MKKTTIDMIAAEELKLYADNDSKTYFSIYMPTVKNLDKKTKKGSFDSEKAVKAFLYVTDYAAKRYCYEFGGIWHKVFNKATREETAKLLLDDYMIDRE